ncbi:MAG: hypothetical protein KAJ88_05755 [Candidatus Aenigmarchaeota archaeon]|nr:hypothetical protein [Candidatus Aenigmarchaeota archaeon]
MSLIKKNLEKYSNKYLAEKGQGYSNKKPAEDIDLDPKNLIQKIGEKGIDTLTKDQQDALTVYKSYKIITESKINDALKKYETTNSKK